MSHVATVAIEIKDLAALRAACKRIGLEFMEGQKSYKWWGRSVGDYPLPEGFTAAELGKCEHALRVKGNDNAYEIGVVRRKDGKPGYSLLWDFYAGGYGLQNVVGENCGLLSQAYAVEAAKSRARAMGRTVTEVKQANGTIQLVCS